MVNNPKISKEEFPLENGKAVIQYIDESGNLSTKSTATFMCEYIYDNDGLLLSHNVSNNPYFVEDNCNKNDGLNDSTYELNKFRKINFKLSLDTINKLNEMAEKKNITKSKLIEELVNEYYF